jgi:hypothetical protein
MLKMSPFIVCLAACASTGGSSAGGSAPAAEEPAPAIQSNDILARDARTAKAEVKHILIGWRDLGKEPGRTLEPRAAARSREEADALAQKTLARVRAGEDIEVLMAELSEDGGSAKFGKSYLVTADANFVFEFKRLALRLDVGEAGLVQSQFGWHVMKRIE